jgi:hypothetical protein
MGLQHCLSNKPTITSVWVRYYDQDLKNLGSYAVPVSFIEEDGTVHAPIIFSGVSKGEIVSEVFEAHPDEVWMEHPFDPSYSAVTVLEAVKIYAEERPQSYAVRWLNEFQIIDEAQMRSIQ